MLALVYALALLALIVLPEVPLPPNHYLMVIGIDDLLIAALVVAVAASVTSTGLSIDSSIKQSEAQADQLKEQARTKRAQGYAEEERIRDLNRRRLRKMREAIGTSGVRADVGTPLDTLLTEVGNAEKDALNVRMGANYAASQANAAAVDTLRAGKIAAAGAGVRGLGEVASLGLSGAAALKGSATSKDVN